MHLVHMVPAAAALALLVAAPIAASAQTATTAPQYRELDDLHVVGPAGEKVGEVEEALIDPAGKVNAITVDVGGFLGIGEKEVVVSLDQLRFENGRLVTTMTKEQIGALPEWKKKR